MKYVFLLSILLCTFVVDTASAQDVTCSTFNIRRRSSDGRNRWANRRDSVARFILAQDIDIVGMQEVLHSQLRGLKKRMPQYEFVGVGRDNGKKKGEYVPIAFRKDRFELLCSGTFWLSQYPDSAGFVGWDGAHPRIATWAKLRERTSGRELTVLNTHLDHKGSEAQRNGAQLIISRIRDIADGQPTILCGDFNVTEQSEAYTIISTSSQFPLLDTHRHALHATGAHYTFHNFGKIPPRQAHKIDFIFTTPDVQIISSHIPSTQGKFYLSDHNPIITHLIIGE